MRTLLPSMKYAMSGEQFYSKLYAAPEMRQGLEAARRKRK